MNKFRYLMIVFATIVCAAAATQEKPKNTVTSPYAVDAIKAAIRTADVVGIPYSRGFPTKVPAKCSDPNVCVFNAITIEGTARQEIKNLAFNRPLRVIDGKITQRTLQQMIREANHAWENVTRKPDCPVEIDDLTRENQEAAAIACCAAAFRMDWQKKPALFMGKSVNEGTSFYAKAYEDQNGKVTLVADLDNGSCLIISEFSDSVSSNGNWQSLEALAKKGSEREVIIPSFSVKVENDYSKVYPLYFEKECLQFSKERRAYLSSFKENVAFSLSQYGVFGISISTATAMSRGLSFSDPPDENAVFVDEPFTAIVVSPLVDRTRAEIFRASIYSIE